MTAAAPPPRREKPHPPARDIRMLVALSKMKFLGRCFNTASRRPASSATIGHLFSPRSPTSLRFPEAIRVSSKVLAIRGRIFSIEPSNVHLGAPRKRPHVHGETASPQRGAPIRKSSYLEPRASARGAIEHQGRPT